MTELNLLGRTIGRFEILSELGRGGMAVVYRARQTDLERTVALKVLPATFTVDPERRQRFEREARAVAALNHPNIVTIYSVEEVQEVHFLTMELVEGRPLVDVIARDGLRLDRLLKIEQELAKDPASAGRAGHFRARRPAFPARPVPPAR